MLGKPHCEKEIKCSASLAFYLFNPTRLINSIKHEHSFKILYSFNIILSCALFPSKGKDNLVLALSTLLSIHHFLIHPPKMFFFLSTITIIIIDGSLLNILICS